MKILLLLATFFISHNTFAHEENACNCKKKETTKKTRGVDKNKLELSYAVSNDTSSSHKQWGIAYSKHIYKRSIFNEDFKLQLQVKLYSSFKQTKTSTETSQTEKIGIQLGNIVYRGNKNFTPFFNFGMENIREEIIGQTSSTTVEKKATFKYTAGISFPLVKGRNENGDYNNKTAVSLKISHSQNYDDPTSNKLASETKAEFVIDFLQL
jgi:hypothetical protein